MPLLLVVNARIFTGLKQAGFKQLLNFKRISIPNSCGFLKKSSQSVTKITFASLAKSSLQSGCAFAKAANSRSPICAVTSGHAVGAAVCICCFKNN